MVEHDDVAAGWFNALHSNAHAGDPEPKVAPAADDLMDGPAGAHVIANGNEGNEREKGKHGSHKGYQYICCIEWLK